MRPLIPALCCFLCFFALALSAQVPQVSLKGKVTLEGEGLPFARVTLKEFQTGTLTDEQGIFKFEGLRPGKFTLKVAAVGFFAIEREIRLGDTAEVFLELALDAHAAQTEEVVITGTMRESFVRESPIKVEVLTERFFRLNPTNSVIEAMQTVNGVQEQVNCGICGTNDIHINGMEGPYTLVMIDGMPIVSALASVYGFNGLPVSLIEQVEIVKGPASSLYGSEAVGGVINIITKRPETAPRLSINGFYTSHRELNFDAATSQKIGKRWSTLLSGDVYHNAYRLDENGDGFTDIPLTQRISLFNRWSMQRAEGKILDLAVRGYYEDRFGGVMDWTPSDRGSDEVYGESIRTHRLEMLGRYELPFTPEKLRLDFSYNFHDQDSYYGDTWYAARQQTLFANLVWQKQSGRHTLLGGLTGRYQTYNDNTPATPNVVRSWIPGIFLQEEYKFSEAWNLLGGMRLDHHRDHGFVFTPRLAMKYKPSEWSTFRLNAGKGFRLVNLFTEDHAALTGSRTVVIEEELKPEESYNLNLNFNHVFLLGKSGTGTLDADLFYTFFRNKIIPDYDTDPNLILYRNLGEHAIVRGASLALNQRFTFPLEIKVGATYQEVYNVETDPAGQVLKNPQEFAPRWSGIFVVSYEWKKLGLTANYTGRVVGPMALPTYAEPFARPEISPCFTVQNLQLTRVFGKGLELYAGVKNLWNYTQPSPLIAPENPFGEDFDTAYAYGPLQGRRGFLGLRWRIN